MTRATLQAGQGSGLPAPRLGVHRAPQGQPGRGGHPARGPLGRASIPSRCRGKGREGPEAVREPAQMPRPWLQPCLWAVSATGFAALSPKSESTPAHLSPTSRGRWRGAGELASQEHPKSLPRTALTLTLVRGWPAGPWG